MNGPEKEKICRICIILKMDQKWNKVEEKRPKKNGKVQKTTETKATRQNMKGLRKG